MSKPDDIPAEVWDEACAIEISLPGKVRGCIGDVPNIVAVLPIARAITAAEKRGEGRSAFTDEGCDHTALASAVDVLRMQQAQPHKSTQAVLWEAIKDYADRAAIRKRASP